MKILTHLDKWCDEAFSCKERELVNMFVNNNSHQTEPSSGTEPTFRDKHVLNVKHSQMQSSEVTAFSFRLILYNKIAKLVLYKVIIASECAI